MTFFLSINFYLELETSLRDFCLKLYAKASSLHTLPGNASFNIQLHTTELAKEEFNSNPAFEVKYIGCKKQRFVDNIFLFQNFPWVLVSGKEGEIPCANIIPLYSVDTESVKLQLYIEKCCKD